MLTEKSDSLPAVKTFKYMKYAVGEIVLVVIGILIALQINSWQEKRKNIRQESKTLYLLKEEYQENLNQLNEKIEFRNAMIDGAFKLMALIDGEHDLADASKDSIEFYIGKTIPFPTFNPSMGVTNDIINSGKLYIIRNSEIRIFLSGWSSDISQITEIEKVWLDYANKVYVPYLIENYSYRNAMNNLWKNLNLTGIMQLNDAESNQIEIGASEKEVDLTALFQHKDFEDHLSNLLAYNHLANSQSLAIKQKIEKVMQIINKELQNL